MVSKHLQPRPHDHHEEEEAQKVCPADESGHPRRHRRGERDAGVPGQESVTGAAGEIELRGHHQDNGGGDPDPS